MIPEADTEMTVDERARWRLTCLVYALHRDGIPEATLMLDVRDGLNRAKQTMARKEG